MSFNINSIMKQAQKMQQEMTKIQEELSALTVESEAAGSGVKVICSGQGEILQVKIPKEIVNPEEVEMLEDLILMAVRDALRKAQEVSSEKMGKITGGMKIPGLGI